MYVIYDTNDNNRIILGPIDWRPKFFSTILSEEYEQNINVIVEDRNRVPYEIISGVFVRECDTQYPDADPDTEDMVGPTWQFHANGSATATWTKTDKPLHIIKNIHFDHAAQERYKKEVGGFKHTINGKEYTISTSREDRSMFLLGMRLNFMPKVTPNATIKWKFQEGFADLNRAQVEELLLAYISYIQGQFEWENTIRNRVRDSLNKDSIKAIEIKTRENVQ